MEKDFDGSKNEQDTDSCYNGYPIAAERYFGEVRLQLKIRVPIFLSSIKYALDTDPEIISKRREIEAKLAAVEVAEAQKDFQVGTTLYGGIEDVTDNTKGFSFGHQCFAVGF